MTRLSININKVALIRNSRGGNLPNLTQVAMDCERFGAEGITVHPRPDERHIRYADLTELKAVVKTEFNIEGYPSEKFIQEVIACKPHQVTLVPDPPGVLTSDRGWEISKNLDFLKDVIAQFHEFNIRTSLFLDADPKEIQAAVDTGTDRIELYTGDYAKQFPQDPTAAIQPHLAANRWSKECGLGLNAGHDLNLKNLAFYKRHMSNLQEVSIGHALVSDALYLGFENTIAMYRDRLRD